MLKLLTQPCYEPVPSKYLRLVAFFLFFILILGATGCSTQVQYVKQTEYVYTPIPERLKKKCPVTAPPPVASFSKATKDEKIEMLADYSQTLLGDIGKCNIQNGELWDFDVKQQKVVENQNGEKKAR